MTSAIFHLQTAWNVVSLGDACRRGGGDIQTGPFGSQLHASDYVLSGVPSIMPQNIGDNRIITDGIARITETDARRLSRYRVRMGDIVCSRRGDVERRALVREHEDGWLCGTGCLRVRFGNGIVDPLYASYYLDHANVREWIVRHAIGATMPNLNTSILSSLPFVLPPLLEQQAIGSILGTLDDKIELNRHMNETLESMARALFQSWFVDFDPVRARMKGRQPSGMDAETAALFPCAFADSLLGEIPQGWNVIPLDETAQFLNGLALQKFPASGGDYLPVIKIAELRRGVTATSDKASRDIPAAYVVNDGEILFSWSGSLEALIWTGGQGALNQHLFKVTSDLYPQWFVYQWVKEHLPVFQQIAASKATTMGHIQRHHLREALVLMPSPDTLAAMTRIMGPLLDQAVCNAIENRALANLRDMLLPKLMSGEVRVRDAEKIVEAVV